METGTKTIIGAFTLAISILFCLFVIGCGKRITSTEKHYIKNDSLKIENSVELRQNLKLSNIGKLKPFDALKPMIIDGKEYFNVTFEFDKSVDSNFQITAGNNLSYKGSDNSGSTRNTEKTDYSNIWIGLSFVIGILFVLYLTLKKYIP